MVGKNDAVGHKDTAAFCPYYQRAVELIGSRWTGAVLRAMNTGVCRFSDLTASIPGLSDRMLSERLKELEAEGIVARVVLADSPARVEYHLTAKGSALDRVMSEIGAWAERWITEPAPASG
ncbi:MAG TPA: helix-turn-helix domain-containing protein [Dehalococcoidia bacterium]